MLSIVTIIEQIVNEAIPQDSCPRREAAAKNRRKILKDRIEKIAEPRDKTQPFIPPLEYKVNQQFIKPFPYGLD